MAALHISQFSNKLISIKNKIDTAGNEYKIWCSLWFDMIGTLYSFYKALPLLQDTNRQHHEIVKDAKKILDLMKRNGKIEDNKLDAWFDGYYLNNAEFRISLAFHCLLKTCYTCNRDHQNHKAYVPQLIEHIPKKYRCPKCQSLPIRLNKRVKNILNDFRASGMPNNTGEYLYKVHSRVNSFKHTPSPVEDLVQTHRRMKEAWEGLLGIYDLFSYIAKKRGALRRS